MQSFATKEQCFSLMGSDIFSFCDWILKDADPVVKSLNIINAGTGYSVDDNIPIIGDGSGATAKITSIDTNGEILDTEVTSPGTGYLLYALTNLTGIGNGDAEITVNLGDSDPPRFKWMFENSKEIDLNSIIMKDYLLPTLFSKGIITQDTINRINNYINDSNSVDL